MSDVGEICYDWWRSVLRPKRETGAARAARARLRRAAVPLEALTIAEVAELNRILSQEGFDLRSRPDTLALISVALAHVSSDHQQTASQRFGGQNEERKLSGVRFERLIRAGSAAELMRPLTRALALIDHGANVRSLSADLYWWSDRTRARWCFDYFGAGAAAPSPSPQTGSEEPAT